MRAPVKSVALFIVGATMIVHMVSQSRYFMSANMLNSASNQNESKRQQEHSQRTNQPNFCPGVIGKYFNQSQVPYLTKLYHDGDRYHNLGGSLKALQEFLDDAIDHTYVKLGLDFVVDDNGPASAVAHAAEKGALENSLQTKILSELKRRDVDNRGGYYQRSLPGNFLNVPKNMKVADLRFLDVMQPKSAARWDIAMGPRLEQDSCRGYSILPGPPRKRYEDKYICGWDQLASKKNLNEDNPQQQDCNIISIGSNDEWGFENNIVQSSHCRIATFDCTIQRPRRKPATDQVKFYSKCIADESRMVNGRSFETYAKLLEQAHFNSSRVHYLKMDIEGHEYDVVTAMIRQAKTDNQLHLLPEQLQLEFHYGTWMHDLPWTLRTRETGELAMFFSMLFREAGYMAVHIEQPSGIPSLREVLMLRVFC